MTTLVRRDLVALIAVVFGVSVLALALSGRVDSDEGRLTYLGAQIAADDFAAGLFLQKLHPALSLLYLPTAALGWKGFVVAHVLLTALGVLAVGRWAGRLGGEGWLAALTVAASPAYWFSAATGQSNSDGLALLAVGLWLYEGDGRRQRFAAGVVLGLTVWARYEFAAFVGVLVLVALARPGRRDTVLGALVFPLLYLSAGAVYHRAPLWFLQNPPMEATPPPGLGEVFRLTLNAETVRRIFSAYALVAGAWALLFTPAAFARGGSARATVVVSAVLLLAFTVSPFFGIDGPEVAPRYLSIALLGIAVAVAFAREAIFHRALAVVPLIAAAAWAIATARFRPMSPLFALATVALLAPAVVTWLRGASRSAALATLAFLSTAAVAIDLMCLRDFESVAPPSRALAAVLRASAQQRPTLILTNVQLLTPALVASGAGPARYIPAFDIMLGLHLLSNHRNGQYESVIRGASSHYETGGMFWPCEFSRHEFHVGDLIVLGTDARPTLLVPDTIWSPHTEVVEAFGDVTIRRFTTGPVRLRLPTPPAWLDPRIVEAPCRALAWRR